MKTITVTGFFGATHEIQVEDNEPQVTVAPDQPEEDK